MRRRLRGSRAGRRGRALPHVAAVQHVFLDARELSQHRPDVCHVCNPLHQPHLSQRNRHLEMDPQAEGGHRHSSLVGTRQPRLGNRAGGWVGWEEEDECKESSPIKSGQLKLAFLGYKLSPALEDAACHLIHPTEGLLQVPRGRQGPARPDRCVEMP